MLVVPAAHVEIYESTLLLFSIIGSIFCIFSAVLMKKIKVWNGYMLLISSMTYTQLIYNLSLYPNHVNLSLSWKLASKVFQYVGGISNALFSNIMATIVLSLLIRKTSANIMKSYKYYCLFISLFVILEIVLFLVGESREKEEYLIMIGDDIYFYFRLASIAYNFVCFGIAHAYIRFLNAGIDRRMTGQKDNLFNLVNKLQYYPLVQAISRSGLAWYELAYGYEFDPANVSRTQFACQIYFAFISPSASVGYLLIFIATQPRAIKVIRSWLGYADLREKNLTSDYCDEGGSSGSGDNNRKYEADVDAEDNHASQRPSARPSMLLMFNSISIFSNSRSSMSTSHVNRPISGLTCASIQNPISSNSSVASHGSTQHKKSTAQQVEIRESVVEMS